MCRKGTIYISVRRYLNGATGDAGGEKGNKKASSKEDTELKGREGLHKTGK